MRGEAHHACTGRRIPEKMCSSSPQSTQNTVIGRKITTTIALDLRWVRSKLAYGFNQCWKECVVERLQEHCRRASGGAKAENNG